MHGEHSDYGDATMSEVFGYAFKPLAHGGAGLDFLTLSDYVSGYPAWNEIGRYQAQYPRNLVVRSDEVITYRGHTNNHGSADFVDYRTVPDLRAPGRRLAHAPERGRACPATSSRRSTAAAAGPRSTTPRSSRR